MYKRFGLIIAITSLLSSIFAVSIYHEFHNFTTHKKDREVEIRRLVKPECMDPNPTENK